MAKAELGAKRTCLSCNMRFYDFNRKPIICPGCGAEFDPINPKKIQKGRGSPPEETKLDRSIVEDNAGDVNNGDIDFDDATDSDMDFDEDDIGDKEGPGVIQDEISADDDLLPKMHENNE